MAESLQIQLLDRTDEDKTMEIEAKNVQLSQQLYFSIMAIRFMHFI